MADTPTTISNAQALSLKYGPGKLRSAAEVSEWQQALRTHYGMTAAQACVLSRWMGTGAKSSPFMPAWLEGETAEKSCARDFSDPPTVDDALEALRKRSALVADLVVAKAEEKGFDEWKTLAANAFGAAKQGAGEAYVAAKEAAKKVKDEVKDAVKTLQDDGSELLKNSAKNFWDFVTELVPWWAFALGIFALLVAGGVFLWWQTRGVSAGLGIAGALGGLA